MKVIDKRGMDVEDREALHAEISIMRLLKHKNLVLLKDVYNNPLTLFIVMELLEGKDLLTRCMQNEKKDVKYSEDEARIVIRQILTGVNYMHSLGVVHRDLKPNNVIFVTKPKVIGHEKKKKKRRETEKNAEVKRKASKSVSIDSSAEERKSDEDEMVELIDTQIHDDDVVKIVDFGFSSFIDPAKGLSRPCGTLKYFAPEMIVTKNYDEKIDLWSIGVILYRLVVGRCPFIGQTDKDLIAAIKSGEFNRFDSHWRMLSNNCQDLICKLLTLDVRARLSAEAALDHPWFDIRSAGNNSNRSKVNHYTWLHDNEGMKKMTIEEGEKKQELLQNFDGEQQNGDIQASPENACKELNLEALCELEQTAERRPSYAPRLASNINCEATFLGKTRVLDRGVFAGLLESIFSDSYALEFPKEYFIPAQVSFWLMKGVFKEERDSSRDCLKLVLERLKEKSAISFSAENIKLVIYWLSNTCHFFDLCCSVITCDGCIAAAVLECGDLIKDLVPFAWDQCELMCSMVSEKSLEKAAEMLLLAGSRDLDGGFAEEKISFRTIQHFFGDYIEDILQVMCLYGLDLSFREFFIENLVSRLIVKCLYLLVKPSVLDGLENLNYCSFENGLNLGQNLSYISEWLCTKREVYETYLSNVTFKSGKEKGIFHRKQRSGDYIDIALFYSTNQFNLGWISESLLPLQQVAKLLQLEKKKMFAISREEGLHETSVLVDERIQSLKHFLLEEVCPNLRAKDIQSILDLASSIECPEVTMMCVYIKNSSSIQNSENFIYDELNEFYGMSIEPRKEDAVYKQISGFPANPRECVKSPESTVKLVGGYDIEDVVVPAQLLSMCEMQKMSSTSA